MTLNGKQRRYLRGLAHSLQPVLSIGRNGLTGAVLAELNQVLDDHELVKIKLPEIDPEARKTLLDELCNKSGAEFVQLIGRTAVVYRPGEKQKVVVPKV